MKKLTLTIFAVMLIVACVSKCQAQSGTLSLGKDTLTLNSQSKDTYYIHKVVEKNCYAIRIQPEINGCSAIINAPISRLVILLEEKMKFSFDEIKMDTTLCENSYYLMVGDNAAYIDKKRRLVIRDSVEATKILSAIILNP